ncbi:hypothetical protein KBZ10_18265 [Streptomyces sp. F63]|uniref:hypothetical protein n=1 Tax=Streptomyces sp. F63 TaxID=2824887 RepID=UPI001B38DCEF|nr:hypothetical protein [Streptomyces sp. F63]MBQ0986421.1 hypothetical protein [Streptomyces sp. F63]
MSETMNIRLSATGVGNVGMDVSAGLSAAPRCLDRRDGIVLRRLDSTRRRLTVSSTLVRARPERK